MNFGGSSLAEWLDNQQKYSPNEFPGMGETKYFTRFQTVEEYLNKNVHPHVNQLAMLVDGGYLTDHGPKHIRKVIEKATQLMAFEDCNLTAYEIYILLISIHLHDVGNICGRKGHELNSSDVMRDLNGRLGDETVEKKTIFQIAQAHGGDVDGERDKIGKLPNQEPVLGKFVRFQLLSAILRLSDELSDDIDRAARYVLLKDKLPEESEIYHKFAASLHSVMIDPKGRDIAFHFDVPVKDVHRTFGKGKKDGSVEQIFILDEILERTLKTHLEVMYCTRFLRPAITIDSVTVTIKIYNNEFFEETLDTIGYRLIERGYPREPSGGIYELCPELNNWKNLGKLTGALLDANL